MESNQNIAPQKYIPTDADYKKAELDLLRDGIKRTHKEIFSDD